MSLRTRALLLSTIRAGIGLASIVTPRTAAKLASYPPEQDNPVSRLMAGMFGVRELLLAWLVVDAARRPGGLTPSVLLLQAAVDAADIVVQSVPVYKREGMNRGALGGIAVAATASVLWFRMAGEARRT